MSTEIEPDVRQINFRVNSKVRRMGERLARSRGESLPAMSKRLLEDHVKVGLGIDPSLTGDELDIALLDAETASVHGELASLEAEKARLQGDS